MMAKPALRSMTGYAQARIEQDGWALRLSVRSVNHRFLDLHFHLPEGFEVFEPRLRQALRQRARRGHIDVTLHFEPAGGAAVQVNRTLAAAYLEAARDLGQQFGIQAEPDVAAILRLPGVIAPAGLRAEDDEELAASILSCLQEALSKLDEMRLSEGRLLAEEMADRLARVEENAARIAALADPLCPAYARRLQARLEELLGASPIDPARLAQEAALIAEHSDISEEVARLNSHVRQFSALLASSAEAGKKLDFLLQEMQREANTLLSKTPGLGAEALAITDRALEVKADIEKLREQVQNIE